MKDQSSRHEPASASHWQRLLDQFSQSGLSQASFAKRHGVTSQQMIYWRRRLSVAKQRTPQQSPQIVELAMAQAAADHPQQASPFELRFPSGMVLRLPSEASVDQLFALITRWEQATCSR